MNAYKNILYIAKSYLKNQTRPEVFSRKKKIKMQKNLLYSSIRYVHL